MRVLTRFTIATSLATAATSCSPSSVPTALVQACPSPEQVSSLVGTSTALRMVADGTFGLCQYRTSAGPAGATDPPAVSIFSALESDPVWDRAGFREAIADDLPAGVAERLPDYVVADLGVWYPSRRQLQVFFQAGTVMHHVVIAFDETVDSADAAASVFIELRPLISNVPVFGVSNSTA
ncbi:MAG: hypothetical protein NTZ21_04395 [Actinobacteria bacterium]|nr:hypothetical protein [Actinomycetota bacterium]